MNRKIVALLLAVMLVASSVAAMAALDTAAVDALVEEANNAILADVYAQPWEYTTGKYNISDEGIWMVIEYPYYVANYNEVYDVNTGALLNNPADATSALAYCAAWMDSFMDQEIIPLTREQIYEGDVAALEALYPQSAGWCWHWVANNRVYIFKGTTFKDITLTSEYVGNVNGDASGLPTTGADGFYHHYTNYQQPALVGSVNFVAKSFGNGVTFSHTSAKQLFTINVKYDCNAWIQIRDDEGRLYPVAGASYNAAKNGYTMTLKKGDNTISWYGADGAGWHKAGSAASPATIKLDVNMEIETVEKNLVTGKPYYTDVIDIRFDYIVKHSVDNHVAADASASAPKTGDAGMAYMTLAALIVMMGAAVVVTRKVRNF